MPQFVLGATDDHQSARAGGGHLGNVTVWLAAIARHHADRRRAGCTMSCDLHADPAAACQECLPRGGQRSRSAPECPWPSRRPRGRASDRGSGAWASTRLWSPPPGGRSRPGIWPAPHSTWMSTATSPSCTWPHQTRCCGASERSRRSPCSWSPTTRAPRTSPSGSAATPTAVRTGTCSPSSPLRLSRSSSPTIRSVSGDSALRPCGPSPSAGGRSWPVGRLDGYSPMASTC
jgi:hypothetical protein